MFDFVGLFAAFKNNFQFIIEFVVIIFCVILFAYIIEKVLKRYNNDKERVLTTRKIAVIGVFSAIAGILMSFEIPVFFIPEVFKFEIGDLPALICGFAFGPVSGVLVLFFKIVVKLIIRSTGTAFVGELANFIISCSFVLPATIMYRVKKSKKMALLSVITGSICMVITGVLVNRFYLIPTFVEMYYGGDSADLIAMGSETNSLINSIPMLVVLGALPMNIMKSVVNSTLCMFLYKPLSPIIKSENKEV